MVKPPTNTEVQRTKPYGKTLSLCPDLHLALEIGAVRYLLFQIQSDTASSKTRLRIFGERYKISSSHPNKFPTVSAKSCKHTKNKIHNDTKKQKGKATKADPI